MSERNFGGMEAKTPTSSKDIYKDICGKVDEILNYRDALSAAFGGSVPVIENGYRIMQLHINKAIRDEPIQAQKNEINAVEQIMDILIHHQIYNPITPIFKDLTVLLIKLFRNWNDNCINSDRLREKINYLDRLFFQSLTMMETIQVLKQLTSEAKKLLEYEPPAFKLSRAYFNTIQDVMNENEEP